MEFYWDPFPQSDPFKPSETSNDNLMNNQSTNEFAHWRILLGSTWKIQSNENPMTIKWKSNENANKFNRILTRFPQSICENQWKSNDNLMPPKSMNTNGIQWTILPGSIRFPQSDPIKLSNGYSKSNETWDSMEFYWHPNRFPQSDPM